MEVRRPRECNFGAQGGGSPATSLTIPGAADVRASSRQGSAPGAAQSWGRPRRAKRGVWSDRAGRGPSWGQPTLQLRLAVSPMMPKGSWGAVSLPSVLN